MKAQELRIGNYVWDDYGGNMIIHQISNDLVDCKKENHLPSGRFDLSSIKPIVIDGNWLMKLGFEKSNNNTRFHTFDKDKLSIHLKSDQYKNGRTYFNSWCIIDKQIDYVHQLQNLYFALAGEELTLK